MVARAVFTVGTGFGAAKGPGALSLVNWLVAIYPGKQVKADTQQ